MRFLKWPLIPLVLLCESPARADSLTLDIGYARGDTATDDHAYAKTLQNELFAGKKLTGQQIEASYQLRFRPLDFFTTSWIFGLGQVRSAVSDSYPGGTLKLERNSSLALVGYRVQDETLVPDFVGGIEIIMVTGLQGRVVLHSPAGRETYTEDFRSSYITIPTMALTAGYRLTPALLLNAKWRVAAKNFPNFFVGLGYDLSHL